MISHQIFQERKYFASVLAYQKKPYESKFGVKPIRLIKGAIINTGHDFSLTSKLMPHPIYGWMSWVCILSPSKENFEDIYPLIKEGHACVPREQRSCS